MKTVRVRFPSDEEWAERQRRRKVIIKNLGRGMSETTVANKEEADAALLAKLRLEPEPELDAFEAMNVIEQLGQAEVEDVEQEGGTFRVLVRVLGGMTPHVLKMPSAKDVFDYRRGFARVLDLPYGKQELSINLNCAGTLYKKLCVSTEGYEGDVPLMHQAVAVKAAVDAMESAFAEGAEASF